VAGVVSGSRKYTFGLISSMLYLGVCTFLGLEGLATGADPTSLGIMFGGLATGIGAVMGFFAWGNAKEWEAKASNGGIEFPK